MTDKTAIEKAARKVLASRDACSYGGQEVQMRLMDKLLWSPSKSLVDSSAIHELREALAAIEAEKPADSAEECLSKMFRDIRKIGYITDPLRLTNESHDACVDLLNHFAESYHAEQCTACRKDRQQLPEAPRV